MSGRAPMNLPAAVLAAVLAASVVVSTQPTQPAPSRPASTQVPPAQPSSQPSSSQPEAAQPPPPAEPTFRTRTSGVRIDVLVTDGGERPIPNLTAADFELTDSGVAQQIEVITLRDRPVDIIIVLDTSASLGEDGLKHLLDATDRLLAGLTDSDRAALVTFSRGVMMRSALTSDRDSVRGMLTGLKAEGATSVIDATYAATTLRTQADRAALMLVFSDGVDTTSWLRPDKVLETVRRSSLVPYAIVVGEAAAAIANAAASGPDRDRDREREPIDATDGFLRDLVTTGGGLFTPAAETGQLERRFTEALDNFRQRYVLTYTPRGVDASGWHPVTVKVKGKHRVRARPGYLVQ